MFGLNSRLNRNILAIAWRALQKIASRAKIFAHALTALLRLYFAARFLRGKVDVPKFEIVVTTKCTLRCEACANMMQYFDKDTYYTCTLDGIIAGLEALFRVADSVQIVNVLGGEPLLHKDLAGLLRFLRESPKVRGFNIVTNGTLDFKEDVLDALEGTSKATVTISDYSASPNLKVPLRHETIIAALEERKIAWKFAVSTVRGQWVNPGKRYKRGRSKEDVVKNFRACMMDCVSVMSGEGLQDAQPAPLGAAFVCPVASALSRLKGLAEFEGDFIDFARATKARVIDFYAQDYFKACDYCRDMWEEKRFVTPAVQTGEVYRVEASS